LTNVGKKKILHKNKVSLKIAERQLERVNEIPYRCEAQYIDIHLFISTVDKSGPRPATPCNTHPAPQTEHPMCKNQFKLIA
jgi:hypothetical protein